MFSNKIRNVITQFMAKDLFLEHQSENAVRNPQTHVRTHIFLFPKIHLQLLNKYVNSVLRGTCKTVKSQRNSWQKYPCLLALLFCFSTHAEQSILSTAGLKMVHDILRYISVFT